MQDPSVAPEEAQIDSPLSHVDRALTDAQMLSKEFIEMKGYLDGFHQESSQLDQ